MINVWHTKVLHKNSFNRRALGKLKQLLKQDSLLNKTQRQKKLEFALGTDSKSKQVNLSDYSFDSSEYVFD